MPASSLSLIIERLNKLSNAMSNPVPFEFAASGYNSNSLYRINNINVKIKTNESITEQDSLLVVVSKPLIDKDGLPKKDISAALSAEDSIIRREIKPHFNHTYLYRDYSGMTISTFTEHEDLFNFFKCESAKKYSTLADLRFFTAQLLMALRAYHQVHLAHRDIKPENFLVCKQDTKFIVKLCDHDEVLVVRDNGVAKYPPNKVTGSVEYRSPEVRVATSNDLKKINFKASDCYSLGVTLEFLISEMMNHGIFKAFIQHIGISPAEPFVYNGQKQDEFRLQVGHFYQIITRLKEGNPKTRATIDEALHSRFFGNNNRAINKYLRSVRNAAVSSLTINNRELLQSIATYNSAIYLIPKPLKAVYLSGSMLAYNFRDFMPAFDNFFNVTLAKNHYCRLKFNANKHNRLSENLDTTPYPADLQFDLQAYTYELKIMLGQLSDKFYKNLSRSIYHVITESIAEYNTLMGVAATHNLGIQGQPTLFQRLNNNMAHELQFSITSRTSYQESFTLISKFIGESRGFGKHTFKNLLMKNLLCVLHERLDDVKKMVYGKSRKRKREA